ncbi:WD40/YVTN/BNR-like repeat-containing protein [Zhongshania sp.]|uniref:WD40/YVTN/BNR-like repeat-containing protein n=1 Tax=Zhongshania sp. TaxID=1971902 RepID=UPI003565650A
MKLFRIVTCYFIFYGFSFSAIAGSIDTSLVRGGIAHDALFDVDMRGKEGFAVGTAGLIYRTEDGGETWMLESNDNRLALLSVSFSKFGAVAVGQYGLILVRSASGEWQKVESGTEERLFAVDINNSGYAIVGGSFGTILRSMDGGRSWDPVSPSWQDIFDDPDNRLGGLFDPSVYGVKVSETGRAWIVGELSLIMNSDDKGMTWTIKNAGGSSEDGVSPTLSAIDIRKDGVAFAVGQEGAMLKSRDYGNTWEALRPVTHQNLLGVKAKLSGLVVVPGMRDIIMSVDDGDTWKSVEGLDIQTGWYGSVAIPDSKNGAIVVGNNGNIIKIK